MYDNLKLLKNGISYVPPDKKLNDTIYSSKKDKRKPLGSLNSKSKNKGDSENRSPVMSFQHNYGT